MAGKTSIKFETKEFHKEFELYMKMTSKTLPEALNRKAYDITRKAIRLTKKTDKKKIQDLYKAPRNVKGSYKDYLGRRHSQKKHLKYARVKPIIQRQWNVPWDQMAKIEQMAKHHRELRLRAIGFMRSGWLPALKGFGAKLPRAKKTFKGVKQQGRAKGKFVTAEVRKDMKQIFAYLSNATGKKSKQAEALKKYGKPALARAFRAERASMKRYIIKKLSGQLK